MIYNLQDHVLFQYKITLKLKLTQNKQFFEKMDLFVNSKLQFLQTYWDVEYSWIEYLLLY